MSRATVLPTDESYEARKRRLRSEARLAVSRLTARETEVLHAIGRGDPVLVVGERLGMSDSTVWDHITAICTKTGVSAAHSYRCFQLRTLALRAGITSVWAA